VPTRRRGSKGIELHPIAFVRNEVQEERHEGWDEIVSEIVLDGPPAEALDGIEDYSHVQVIFWMSRLDRGRHQEWKIHPRGRHDLPLVGIFATRTQYRPNPLGLTTVQVLGRQGPVLKVKGLDAYDGTPVIDIKPLSPGRDIVENIRYPDWVRTLHKPSR